MEKILPCKEGIFYKGYSVIGTGEMPQLFRVLAGLPEAWALVPSTYMAAQEIRHLSLCNSSALFWPP